MAVFNFSRFRRRSPDSGPKTLESALQVERLRLLQARASAITALDTLRPNDPARGAISAARDLIGAAVLALHPVRLTEAGEVQGVSHG